MSTDAEDGGPAFPQQHYATGSTGMMLRDYFAAKAMQAVVASSVKFFTSDGHAAEKPEHFARMAYEMADAMLKARSA